MKNFGAKILEKKDSQIFHKIIFVLLALLAASVIFFLDENKDLNQQTKNLKAITFSGEKKLPNGLTVEPNEILTIQPGTTILIGQDQQIIVRGKIIAKGTPEKPIIFQASQDYWRGISIQGINATPIAEGFWSWISKGDEEKNKIFFDQMKNGNAFTFCQFKNVSTPSREFAIGNKWKAAIEAYDTDMTVSDCKFDDILHVGGVLAQRSFVDIANNEFLSDTIHKDINMTDNVIGIISENKLRHNRETNKDCADGIWIKNSTMLISKNNLTGIADDAIQGSDSKLVIANNIINKTQENGIDLDGKNGMYLVFENQISNIKKSAVMISDQAKVLSTSDVIKDAENGVTLRDGAKLAANEMSTSNAKNGIIALQDIPCALSSATFLQVKNRLQKISDDSFSELHLEEIATKKQLIETLEKYYQKENNIFILNEDAFLKLDSLKLLSEMFRSADIYSLPQLQSKQADSSAACLILQNSISLASSKFANVENDFDVKNNHRLQISDTLFSNEKNKQQALLQTTEKFSCPLVDSSNISATRSNMQRILNANKK